jgi:hypothetical protein
MKGSLVVLVVVLLKVGRFFNGIGSGIHKKVLLAFNAFSPKYTYGSGIQFFDQTPEPANKAVGQAVTQATSVHDASDR